MSDEDADERAKRLDRKAEAERRDWRETKRLRAEGTGARAWWQRMKVQVRDVNTWALLAEADLTGKKFTVVGGRLINDEDIDLTVTGTGTMMRDAFLVSDDGRVIRAVTFDTLGEGVNVGPGTIITVPAGDLKWGR
jgi:hypothetical protein